MQEFAKPDRLAIEDFLFTEADLLDDWRLPEWLELFTEDGEYLVPSVGISNQATADPQQVLFLIADDRRRIEERVKRLMKDGAHAEFPHSRTRHCFTNVRILGQSGNQINVSANFVVYRTRLRRTIQYMGKCYYTLVAAGDSFRIRSKRSCLDLDALTDQGRVTIIV